MEVHAIIAELDKPHGLPREALVTASSQREELAPIFIEAIENYIAAAPHERTHPDALFFMFHLLGEWRETSAYPTLARLLRLPAPEMDRILDDAVTATSHRVIISVFDGDPEPLYDIILDPDASEFVRCRMCEALAILVRRGQLERASVAVFLHACFASLEPQGPCLVWHGWQNAIAMLGLKKLAPLVKKAFRQEYIDPELCDYAVFERNLRLSRAMPGENDWLDETDHQPFGSTSEEFSKWRGFTEAYRQDLERARQAANDRWLSRGQDSSQPHKADDSRRWAAAKRTRSAA